LLVLGVLALAVNACDEKSRVRAPSPEERRGIVAEAKRWYEYESDVTPYRRERLRAFNLLGSAVGLRLRPLHLRPSVVAIRVSRSDPLFAAALVELRDSRGRRMPGTSVLVFRKVRDLELPWEPVAGTATGFSRACTDATPEGVRDLVCPDPWSVLGHGRPQIRLNTTVAMPIRSPNLRAVDWNTVTLPGAACGATQPIRLRRGQALVHSAVDPWWPAVFVSSSPRTVSYGDLDGDRRDEAAVGVVCSNMGGTASGQLAFASVIFTARRRTMRALGIVTPRQPLAPASHVPALGLGGIEIRRGQVIAEEFWYGPNDGTCCASGLARTTWTYAGGSLHPAQTLILRQPER
jgi:hypothetical protein